MAAPETEKGDISGELAHARLGDISLQTLKMMSKHSTAKGLNIYDNGTEEPGIDFLPI